MRVPVRIVLVETSHPGNIGAIARAMKTMNLDDLVLVSPKDFPSAEATARASGADDVLSQVRVVDSLSEAVADCGFVVGASARFRSLPWPAIDPRGAAKEMWSKIAHTQVAAVFGPEHSGLTNEDMAYCQKLVHIPANPDYSSLNIAMAVQILCYELRMASIDFESFLRDEAPASENPLANAQELEGFHQHLEDLLADVGFLNPDHPKQLKLRLRRIFHRASLDRNEVNILRGVLAALSPDSSNKTEKNLTKKN